jgi:hypothetical protein
MAKEQINNQRADTSASMDSKLAAIKEIIFGQEQAELKHELDELKALILEQNSVIQSELKAARAQMEATMKSMDAEIDKKLEAHQKSTDKAIARVDKEKANRKALGKMLVNIGEKLMKDD